MADSTDSAAELVGRLLDEQAAGWKTDGRMLAEDIFRKYPGLRAESDSAVDIVYHEFLLREQAGESPRPDEYLRRFPELGDLLKVQFEVHGSADLTELAGAAPGDEPTGRLPEIPGYELVGVLGRGGMGVVYEVRQAGLNRTVAIKMILPGAYAGRREKARFRAEAEAVAQLGHPNIIQIHEIGEYDGAPFLCLEYAGGGTLAGRLDRKPQSPREAADTVALLAGAVQAAHVRGIVHRDLKPANVLIAGDGTLKITDFGLAKRMDAGAGLTESNATVGTPSYMAPEQAVGASAVGPPADVYALGAILYEMLTGRPPFLGESSWDTMIAVVGEEPVPPSRLRAKLPADLETICLNCLRKEPQRRYRTAEELAADLRRFLGGEPVRARPVRWWERAAKWMRRRPAAAALAVVSVLAAAGTVVGAWLYNADLAEAARREARERRRAQLALDTALEAADSLLDQVADRLADVPRTEKIRRELLESALALYQSFLQDHGEDPEVRRRTARASRRAGDIHRMLTRYDESEKAYGRAAEMFRTLAAEFPAEPEHRRELAATHVNSALLYGELMRAAEADAALKSARGTLEELDREFPGRSAYRRDLARAWNNTGVRQAAAGDRDAAAESHARARTIREELSAAPDADPRNRLELAGSWNNLGSLLRKLGKPADSEAAFGKAAELLADPEVRRRFGADMGHRRLTAGLHSNLGAAQDAAKRWDRAAGLYRQSIAEFTALVADFPSLPEFRRSLGETELNLALMLKVAGKPAEAAEAARRADRTYGEIPADHARSPDFRREHGTLLHGVGEVLYAAGDAAGSLDAYRRAAEVRGKLADGFSGDAGINAEAALTLNHLAVLLVVQAGKPADGVPFAERAVRHQLAAMRAAPGDAQSAERLRKMCDLAAAAQLMVGRESDAAKTAEQLAGELPADPEAAFQAACILAGCPKVPGSADRATALLREAVRRGFRDAGRLTTAPELQPLATRADFRIIVELVRRPAP